MTPSDSVPTDLLAVAHQAILEAGFQPTVPAAVNQEIEHQATLPPPEVEDLRHLLWSSIDNVDSRDLDQIELAE